MSQNSKIEWTDHTFNPWWGCTKVSPACTNCYAETFSKRVGQNVWGDDAERRFFGEKHWNEPLKWNAAAKAQGVKKLVFCASMADIAEIHPNPEIAAKQEDARRQLAALIERTENLYWLLLSKRWANFPKIGAQIGWSWDGDKWIAPPNVWAGATVENQEQADKRIPEILEVPARVRFLSMEPLLGPVDLNDERDWLTPVVTKPSDAPRIDWVIAGGESGPGARPSHPDWFRSLRDQCKTAGVPFFMKQWGDFEPILQAEHMEQTISDDPGCVSAAEAKKLRVVWPDGRIEAPKPGPDWWYDHEEFDETDADLSGGPVVMRRLGKKAAGRLLDGVEHSEFPEVRP